MATSLSSAPAHTNGDSRVHVAAGGAAHLDSSALLVLGGLAAAAGGAWLLFRRPKSGAAPAPGGTTAPSGRFDWNGTTYLFIVTASADEAARFFSGGRFCVDGSPECGTTLTRKSDALSRLAFFNPNPHSCPTGKLFWTMPLGIPTWQPGAVDAWWHAHIYGGPLPANC